MKTSHRNEVRCVYADGGVIGRNPSLRGGTWAWVHVDGADGELARRSGLVTPADIGLPKVTNNLTEMLAVVEALEALPDGWSGTLYTDSLVTLLRVKHRKAKMNGIPMPLRERLRKARSRLGSFKTVLLKGHPDEQSLVSGATDRGELVSKWNVACDEECSRLATACTGSSSDLRSDHDRGETRATGQGAHPLDGQGGEMDDHRHRRDEHLRQQPAEGTVGSDGETEARPAPPRERPGIVYWKLRSGIVLTSVKDAPKRAIEKPYIPYGAVAWCWRYGEWRPLSELPQSWNLRRLTRSDIPIYDEEEPQ